MRQSIVAGVLAVAVVLVAIPARALTGVAKPAWEWQLIDRVTVRTHPSAVEALRVTSTASDRYAVRIDGRRNPELFLPIELFRNLLSGLSGDPSGRPVLREAFAPVVERLTLPPDFLDQIAETSSEYIAAHKRIRRLNAELAERPGADDVRSERDVLGAAQCATLFEALESARARYGRERFERFLYEAVAPGMVVVLAEPEDAVDLLKWEGGCK